VFLAIRGHFRQIVYHLPPFPQRIAKTLPSAERFAFFCKSKAKGNILPFFMADGLQIPFFFAISLYHLPLYHLPRPQLATKHNTVSFQYAMHYYTMATPLSLY
jgi:hypothetical protein